MILRIGEINLLEIFNEGWFGSSIGLLGLIVGIVGLVFYMKSKIGTRPKCYMRTTPLIGESEQELPPEVNILFGANCVPRVSLTHLYFWNDGQETVNGSQILKDDPVRFSFSDSHEILKAHVAKVTRSVNKINVTVPSEKKMKLYYLLIF